MSKLFARIIEGLQQAMEGDIPRITIQGQTWARVTDIHADQQEIMRINNELLSALQAVLEIENEQYGSDYEEIDRARSIARAAIARAAGQSDDHRSGKPGGDPS